MNRKKTLVIIIWNMGVGGIQKRIRDICLEISLHHQDWKVLLLVRSKQNNVMARELTNLKNISIRYFSSKRWPLQFPWFVAWLLYQTLVHNPSVIVTFLDYLSVIMAAITRVMWWRNIRLILNEGVLTSEYLKLNQHRLQFPQLIMRWGYHQAHTIIVPTQAVKKDLINLLRLNSQKIKLIPNWTLFKSSKATLKKWDIVYVGRFEYEKGADRLIPIMVELIQWIPQIKIALLGSGSMLDRIKNEVLTSKLSSQVVLLDPEKNLAKKVLQQSKILLLPTRNEGMPNVVLEAGAFGIPTVAWKFLGSEEVIDTGETGYVVETIHECCSACERLLKDSKRLAVMGTKAKELVRQNFSQNRQHEFIQELIG